VPSSSHGAGDERSKVAVAAQWWPVANSGKTTRMAWREEKRVRRYDGTVAPRAASAWGGGA
jgi:hypothetical protein